MFAKFFSSKKPRKKYSLENLKYLYGELLTHDTVTPKNEKVVVEILRNIAEVLIWGDQNEVQPVFDFFAEKNILSNFVKILKQKCDDRVKIQVLQTLSILIQNIEREISVFYMLSNNYLNDLIVSRFDFSNEDLLAYYISFLKRLSLKLNDRTIHFFFNEKANDFPLYTESIKFFNHPESMVRTAVRTISLNVYRIDYPPMREFVLDRTAVPYFSNLVFFLRDQIKDVEEKIKESTYLQHAALEETIQQQVDELYFLQDILNLNIVQLSTALLDQLLSHFILPVLVGSLLPRDKRVKSAKEVEVVDNKEAENQPIWIEPRVALFWLAQVFVVFTDRPFLNSIATAMLDMHPSSLAQSLVQAAPEYPVISEFPLTSILYPRAYHEEDHLQNRGSRTTSLEDAKRPLSTSTDGESSLMIHVKRPSVDAAVHQMVGPPRRSMDLTTSISTPTETGPFDNEDGDSTFQHSSVSENKDAPPVDDDDIPVDQNITNRRGKLLSIGPISTILSIDPNYADLVSSSLAREALFKSLQDVDERVVLGGALVMYCILRNDNVDRRVLIRGEVCPQAYMKKHRLLDALTAADDDDDNQDDLPISSSTVTPEIRKEVVPLESKQVSSPVSKSNIEVKLQLAHASSEDLITVSINIAVPETTEAMEDTNGGDPLFGNAVVETRKPASSSHGPAPSGRHFVVNRPVAPKKPFTFDYPEDVVSTLFGLLTHTPPFRMVTTQFTCYLISEFVQHKIENVPCLNATHTAQLNKIYSNAARTLRACFDGVMGKLLLELFEDEVNEIRRQDKPYHYKTLKNLDLISSSVHLLPIADNAISGLPLRFRHASSDMEKTRLAIHNYTTLRLFRSNMFKQADTFLPRFGNSVDCKWYVDDEIEISGQDVLSCVATTAARKQIKLFFMMDKTNLLLVQQHASKAGWAVVKMVHPLRHQEAFFNRNNACVLHVTMRAQIQPHEACRRLPVPETAQANEVLQGKTLWNLTLEFLDRVACASAKKHLEETRYRLRNDLAESLMSTLDVEATISE